MDRSLVSRILGTRPRGRCRRQRGPWQPGVQRWGRPVVLLALLLGLAAGPGHAQEEPPAEPAWTAHGAGIAVQGVTSLRIHPEVPDRLLAHVHGLGIAASTDGGATWETLHAGMDERHVPRAGDDCVIALDSRDPDVLWVATRGHVYSSENAGERWQLRSSGVLETWSWDRRQAMPRIDGIVVDPAKSLHVVCGSRADDTWRGGLYETTDGGKRWEQIAGNDVEDSGLVAGAWPIVLDPRTDKNIVVGSREGVYFSDDRGRSFERKEIGDESFWGVADLTRIAQAGRDVYLCDARGVWQSKNAGKRWGREPILAGDAVTATDDPHSRRRLYVVLRDRGLLVSEDSRHSKWTELGHAELQATEVLVHPRDSDVVYLASPTTGLHRSEDRGETFQAVSEDLPNHVPAMVAVAAHPVDVDHALAVDVHGGAWVSEDRGESWAHAGWVGMTPRLLLPGTESGAWLVGGSRLLRTPDHGATWEVVWAGEEDAADEVADVERLADGTLLVLLKRSRAVARSEDGGETWEVGEPATKSEGTWAVELAVDPANEAHLLMAATTRRPLWTQDDEDGGPYESWDGGESWERLDEGLRSRRASVRDGNRGRHAAIDAAAGLLLYDAQGAGLFARRIVDPDGERPDEDPVWVSIDEPVEDARIAAWRHAQVASEDEEGADAHRALWVYAEGDEDATVFACASAEALRAAVDRAMAGDEGDEDGEEPADAVVLWEVLPAPPTGVAWLAFDPHVPDRLLAADPAGEAGVLAFGVPGARPAADGGEGSAAVPDDDAGGDGEPAPAPEVPAGLLGLSGGGDGTVRLWALAEGSARATLAGHDTPLTGVAFAPGGDVVVSCGADGGVRIWDVATASPQGRVEGEASVNALVLTPDGTHVYTAEEESWLVRRHQLAPEAGAAAALAGHTAGVLALAITPDGAWLASGGRDRTVRVWPLADEDAEVRVIEPGVEVLALAFVDGGERVAVGGSDGTVRLYRTEDGAAAGDAEVPLGYVGALASAPGRLFVAGDGGQGGVHEVDLETLQLARSYAAGGAAVHALATTADGAWVLAGDAEGALRLWAAGWPEPIREVGAAHADAIASVALAAVGGDAADGAPAESDAPEGDDQEEGAPPAEAPEDEAPEDEASEG